MDFDPEAVRERIREGLMRAHAAADAAIAKIKELRAKTLEVDGGGFGGRDEDRAARRIERLKRHFADALAHDEQVDAHGAADDRPLGLAVDWWP